MSRYIDVDEFYVSQMVRCCGEPVIGTCTNDNVKLYDEIQKFTTADVVPVVRCKDCKYYVDQYCTRDIKCRTNMFYMCATNMFYMCADDFCSYGERKDEE